MLQACAKLLPAFGTSLGHKPLIAIDDSIEFTSIDILTSRYAGHQHGEALGSHRRVHVRPHLRPQGQVQPSRAADRGADAHIHVDNDDHWTQIPTHPLRQLEPEHPYDDVGFSAPQHGQKHVPELRDVDNRIDGFVHDWLELDLGEVDDAGVIALCPFSHNFITVSTSGYLDLDSTRSSLDYMTAPTSSLVRFFARVVLPSWPVGPQKITTNGSLIGSTITRYILYRKFSFWPSPSGFRMLMMTLTGTMYGYGIVIGEVTNVYIFMCSNPSRYL
ncbi:hypothetical protein F4777DRAFT_577595 [Nemania sp. FL0916]|nr:hypothetical protein F4777DRAFT_577595 [Nemania sp. FL0916]